MEPLLVHLIHKKSPVLFIIGGKLPWGNFEPLSHSSAGTIRGLIADTTYASTESDQIDSVQRNVLFNSLETAISRKSEKIVILLDKQSESKSTPMTSEQFDLLRDKLAGSLVNITVGLMDSDAQSVAEKIVLLNTNPYNRVVFNGSSIDMRTWLNIFYSLYDMISS